MKPDKIILLCVSIVLCISLYLNFVNRSESKTSKELNDVLSKQIETMQENEKKRISSDSLRMVNAIDSLKLHEKKLNNIRINELFKLKQKLSKIYLLNNNADFDAVNDSLEKCCSMR